MPLDTCNPVGLPGCLAVHRGGVGVGHAGGDSTPGLQEVHSTSLGGGTCFACSSGLRGLSVGGMTAIRWPGRGR